MSSTEMARIGQFQRGSGRVAIRDTRFYHLTSGWYHFLAMEHDSDRSTRTSSLRTHLRSRAKHRRSLLPLSAMVQLRPDRLVGPDRHAAGRAGASAPSKPGHGPTRRGLRSHLLGHQLRGPHTFSAPFRLFLAARFVAGILALRAQFGGHPPDPTRSSSVAAPPFGELAGPALAGR